MTQQNADNSPYDKRCSFALVRGSLMALGAHEGPASAGSSPRGRGTAGNRWPVEPAAWSSAGELFRPKSESAQVFLELGDGSHGMTRTPAPLVGRVASVLGEAGVAPGAQSVRTGELTEQGS